MIQSGTRKRPLTTARIGVLMGGQSAEREISLMTGRAVCEALRRRRYDAVPVDVDRSLPKRLVEEKIKVAFVALHGPGGEDGTIQGLLEIMGISDMFPPCPTPILTKRPTSPQKPGRFTSTMNSLLPL